MSSVDWTAFFGDAGISSAEAKNYTEAFVRNNIGSDLVEHLDKGHLQDMGITALGDIIRIILNAKKENMAKYLTCKDVPELSNKIEAENVKEVDDNDIEDANIVNLSQKEDSETEVGSSSDEHNVRETINKRNEKVFSCTKCNFSAKTISAVKKHVVCYRDDKWQLQSQTQQKRKSGGKRGAGLDVPDKKECKHQTPMDLKYPDTSMAASKHSSSQDNAKHESQVEKGHGDKSTSQKVGEKSIDTSMVRKHGSSITGKNEKCDLCEYVTLYKATLDRHRISHHGISSDNNQKCNECDFVSVSPTHGRANLKRHIQSKHIEQMRKVGELSIDTSSVSAYMKVKFDEENVRLFCCTICSLTVSNRKALISHIREVHFGLQIFSCDQCPYTSNREGNLKQHRQRKGHTKIRDHMCFHCEFATGTIAELKGHMQSKHDGKISNISLRPMSPVKESEPTDEPMSQAKDSQLSDDNTTGYESMEEAPITKRDLSQEFPNDDGVREETPKTNKEHKLPLISINVNNVNGKRTFKGRPMHCKFCSYKTVQATRIWKHLQKVHNQTIKIIQDVHYHRESHQVQYSRNRL